MRIGQNEEVDSRNIQMYVIKRKKSMRKINCKQITVEVKKLFIEANTVLGDDIVSALKSALPREESATGLQVLEKILENAADCLQKQNADLSGYGACCSFCRSRPGCACHRRRFTRGH